MMNSGRFQLALERLQPSDWERFEHLSSVFLAAEFSELRTTAAASGDGGRDSELFSPEHEPQVAVQYSVAANWENKIVKTAQRLKKTHPQAIALVYMCNQNIGAAADELKRRLRKEFSLGLDVRDLRWFIERVNTDHAREAAADELARVIVEPLLVDYGLRPRGATDLTGTEAVAALTYLGLQWQDDIREKGLTKLAFEALVRSALAHTDPNHRLSRAAVRERVCAVLPGHDAKDIAPYVESALRRLAKKAIRHYPKDDEFCLSHEELLRLAEFKIAAALAEARLQDAIQNLADATLQDSTAAPEDSRLLAAAMRRTSEAVLFQRSQAFALAVQSGGPTMPPSDDLKTAALADLAANALPKRDGVDWMAALEGGVSEVVLSDDPAIRGHLRTLIDAHTLLAFLRQTPDVEAAVGKMFSGGRLWLDTTIALPLLAESLDEEGGGRFTRMMRAAREAGIELYVTAGVIEEIERHMNRAVACARMKAGQWIGRVPYLLDRFAASGRTRGEFAGWLENFRGDEQPENDIASYLEDEFGVQRRDLHEERDRAGADLRNALQQVWYEAHEARRRPKDMLIDEMAITHLVEHDVECYCGITQLRSMQKASPFGYDAWWLTIDRRAFDLRPRLGSLMKGTAPDSPVLSADFLVNYLAFGPVRRRVTKATEERLPLIMDAGIVRYMTPEILDEAEAVREGIRDLPERVIRRRVRDHINRAKTKVGPVARAGLDDLADEILAE